MSQVRFVTQARKDSAYRSSGAGDFAAQAIFDSVAHHELENVGIQFLSLRQRLICSARIGDVVTFFSTLVDNRRTMSVIEPLAQSDRAISNSCFSD